MKKKTHKAHRSKFHSKELTQQHESNINNNKKATGILQPKKGVKINALKKNKNLNLDQAYAGGLIKRPKTKKAKKSPPILNPYTIKGNHKSKNDPAISTEVIASSSSPQYVQQSPNSHNKTRLAKASAKIIQNPHTEEDFNQNEKNFPDQEELVSMANQDYPTEKEGEI